MKDKTNYDWHFCECNCGEKFRRKNLRRRFVNAVHRDRFYNEHVRKVRNKNRTEVLKALDKNERILMKYYKPEDKVSEVALWMAKAEGFQSEVYIGSSAQGVCASFNYNWIIEQKAVKVLRIWLVE